MKTCPKCLAKINNPDAAFCYNCGGRLASDSVNEIHEEKIQSIREDLDKKTENSNPPKPIDINLNAPSANFKKVDTLSKRWNYFIVGVNALSIMFLVLSLGFFFRSINNTKSGVELYPVMVVENIQIQEKDKLKLTESVNKSDYYNIVPKNINFYTETSDLDNVILKVINKNDISYIEKSFDIAFDDFLVFFKKDYAYTKKDDSYAFIFKVGGFDFFDRAYAKYQESKKENAGVYIKRVGEFLVISNSNNLIKSMELVTQGVEPSLVSDPRFKSKLSDVPTNSLFFTYFASTSFVENFVEKELPKLNLEVLQKYVIKFKPNLIYLTKEGANFYLYPIE